jgi:hypothetical protein
MMQQLEGEFAAYYNRRKDHCGSFWGDRFHCTMVEDGIHLWNCLQYIDLNMVRAGAVSHPREWCWCGYQELMGLRQRFCLLDISRLLDLLDMRDLTVFKEIHEAKIDSAIQQGRLNRESQWTEAIAVGSEDYVRLVAKRMHRRKRLRMQSTEEGAWYVRESGIYYGEAGAGLVVQIPETFAQSCGLDLVKGKWCQKSVARGAAAASDWHFLSRIQHFIVVRPRSNPVPRPRSPPFPKLQEAERREQGHQAPLL